MKKKLKKWWRIRQLEKKGSFERTYAETVEYYMLTDSTERISCAGGSSWGI